MIKKIENYAPYFALSVLVMVGLLSFIPIQKDLTGHAVYDSSSDIKALFIEDGASADDIVLLSSFASSHNIKDAFLTNELKGDEVSVLIVQHLGGDSALLKKEGENIILEGNLKAGLTALDSGEQALMDYDVVEVAADGSITGVSGVAKQVNQPIDEVEGVTVNNCIDSDGGDNPFEYGELSGTDIWGNEIIQMDQCGSGTATINDVFEKVCTEESYTYTQHHCDYGCLEGICLEAPEQPVCGDGIVDENEGCDDGNIENSDGCTADCTIEVNKGCWETSTGVAGTYSGYDYYDSGYSTDYSYNDYCYYYDYYGTYYYNNYNCYENDYDGKWYPTASSEQCASGCEDATGCLDVETVEPYCEDSDGADAFTYGTTTSLNKFSEEKIIEDTCYSYTDDYHYVIEGYCSGDSAYTQYIYCDGVCENGVCVEGTEPTCEDSDETDISAPQKSSFESGEVTGTNKAGEEYTNVDECYDSYGYEYVIEQYCTENGVPYTTYVYCQGGCENGICVEPDWEQSCEDSDETTDNAGKDVYVAGSVSGLDYYGKEFEYSDYCYYNNYYDAYYVADYYCAESPSYGSYASSYWEKCPSGCTDGACDPADVAVEATCTDNIEYISGIDQYGNEYTIYDSCNGAEYLVDYMCGNADDSAPYVAEQINCNCVDGMCVEASMSVAEFMGSLPSDTVIVIGAQAATEDNIGSIDLAGGLGLDVVTDATISDVTSRNIIAVGGPYANKVSATALGGEVWDYGPGEALFFLREYAQGGSTLVVSGSEAVDTRNAVKLLMRSPPDYDYGVEKVN